MWIRKKTYLSTQENLKLKSVSKCSRIQYTVDWLKRKLGQDYICVSENLEKIMIACENSENRIQVLLSEYMLSFQKHT